MKAGLKKPTTRVDVVRGKEWDCFKAIAIDSSFKPKHCIDVMFMDASHEPEGSIDAGGPTKELLQALIDHVENMPIFHGSAGNKFPILDAKGEHNHIN